MNSQTGAPAPSSTASALDLFASAQASGALSAESMQSLNAVPDLGATIQSGLGIGVSNVESSEVLLVGALVDDSGSIRFAGNGPVVRDGINHLLYDALFATKQRNDILVHVAYLNGFQWPFRKLVKQDTAGKDALNVEYLNEHNYDPSGGTPLYDQAKVFLARMVAKAQEFEDSGVAVRTVSLILTDGADVHSQSRAESVAPLVRDMQMRENHIVAAIGIDDAHTDFNQVFRSMGLDSKWILTPKNSPSEIRAAFQCFSQSAVRASQGGASFSQTAAGGFTN